MKFDSFIGENLSCTVGFDYTPEQTEIWYPNERAQPGYPADVEITEVIVNGEDILEVLNFECLCALKDRAWDCLEEHNEK
jgi:hypothetical protein